MPGRVHPSMKETQPAGFDHPMDRAPAEPEPEQLAPRHHPVLPLSQASEAKLYLFPLSGNNDDLVSHAATLAVATSRI